MTTPDRPAAEVALRKHLLALAIDAGAPPDLMRRADAFLDKWQPRIEAAVRADATRAAEATVAGLRAERDDWRRQWEDDVARVSGEREALRAEVAVWKGHHRREVEAKRKTAEHNRRLAAEKKAAEAEVARLREALTEAQEVMHDEYCIDRRGVMSHRPVCEAALAALAARPAAGASQPLPAAEVAPTPAAPEAEPAPCLFDGCGRGLHSDRCEAYQRGRREAASAADAEVAARGLDAFVAGFRARHEWPDSDLMSPIIDMAAAVHATRSLAHKADVTPERCGSCRDEALAIFIALGAAPSKHAALAARPAPEAEPGLTAEDLLFEQVEDHDK